MLFNCDPAKYKQEWEPSHAVVTMLWPTASPVLLTKLIQSMQFYANYTWVTVTVQMEVIIYEAERKLDNKQISTAT